MALPKSVPATTKALLLFQGAAHIIEDIGKRLLRAERQRKSGGLIEAAVQTVTKTLSVLSNSVKPVSSKTAYSSYFLYIWRMAMLQVLKSRKEAFLPFSAARVF